MIDRFPPLRPGQPLPAWWLNRVSDAVERLLRLKVAAPLQLTWTRGVPTLALASGSMSSSELTARIVARGAGAFYSWQEVYPTSGGAWADGNRSGSTTSHNALEQNNNSAVPAGMRVRMFLVNSQWTFQLGPCNPLGKAPTIPPEPPPSMAIYPPPDSTPILGSTASITIVPATCVTVEMCLPGYARAGDISAGCRLVLADPVTGQTRTGEVSYAQPSRAPCVRIRTSMGVELECSTTAPIATEAGRAVLAPDLHGKRVPVFLRGESAVDTVIAVDPIGERDVIHITCEDAFFLAGRHADLYLLHHNKRVSL